MPVFFILCSSLLGLKSSLVYIISPDAHPILVATPPPYMLHVDTSPVYPAPYATYIAFMLRKQHPVYFRNQVYIPLCHPFNLCSMLKGCFRSISNTHIHSPNENFTNIYMCVCVKIYRDEKTKSSEDVFICINICQHWNDSRFNNIQSKVKLATLVEGNSKGPFSIASTSRCRRGRYSIP